MKRIAKFKKEFGVTQDTDLKELKSTYRKFMKEWHPDKFADDAEKLAEAEAKSKELIGGYHFLVSINAETHAANIEEYTSTTTQSGIEDFLYEKRVLEVRFKDGNTYEYFGVSDKVYAKLCNAPSAYRIGKRHIFNSYLYAKKKVAITQ